MPTSEQFNNLTESNGGRNVRPKIQPESHFFLEGSGSDYSQIADQAFGPLSTDVFRTTAKVTLGSTKNVYTICKGQVFVQPHTGDDTKVNVILRPFNQPINEIGIKYFIYRGLKKTDFLNEADGEVAAKPTTEFTTFVWDEFEKFYEDEPETPGFSDFFIGWPQTPDGQPTTDLIEKYFNKITPILDPETGEEEANFSYEFPIIPRGTQLGTIDSGEEIGLDIVLNFGEYYIEGDTNPFLLDIAFARAADGLIDLTGLPDVDPADIYQIKLLKEATTQFIDPAAFYGLHANGAGKLHLDDDAVPALTTVTDIYNQIDGFYSKNNVYCYVQANRQRSYNFYGNYEYSEDNSNTLKIGATSDTLTETTFGTLGWPVHVYSSTADQDPGTDQNTLCFQLTTDAHSAAALYIQTGFITSEHENNFVRQGNLLESIIEDPLADIYYTKPVKLETPSQGVDFIAGLVQCIYKGKQMYVEEYHDPPIVDPPKHLIKDIDELFGLVNVESFQVPQSLDDWTKIIDRVQTVLSLNFEDIIVAKSHRIRDLILGVDGDVLVERITYESLADELEQKISYTSKTATSIRESSITGNLKPNMGFYHPNKPYFLNSVSFMDDDVNISCLSLNVDTGEFPTKYMLGLTINENLELQNLIIDEGITDPRVIFENLSFDGVNRFISTDGVEFEKYKILLSGVASSGELLIFRPNENIYVYSVDSYLFASQGYSEFAEIDIEGHQFIKLKI